MADLPLVTRASQIGKETTAGTGVAADKYMTSFGFTRFKPMGSGKIRRGQGNKLHTSSVPPGYRWTEFALDGESVMDFNEFVYLLCAAIKDVSPSNEGTNGKRWTFTLSKAAVDTKRTFTVEQGDSQHAQKVNYAHPISLGMVMSKTEQAVSGNWKAQQIQDDTSMTASPTAITDHTIPPQAFDVRVASSQAALVGTQQVETAIAATTATGSGNITVTVTAAGMSNSPKAVVVAITSGDTASVWAGKVRTALGADADVASFFSVGGSGANIVLTALAAAANDSTLNIAIADTGSTGITPVVTSANTTAGVAPASVFGRPYRVEFSIDGLQDQLPRMNSSEPSFVNTQELAPTIRIKFKTDADDAGMGFLSNWTVGSTTFISITAVGSAIGGTANRNYSFTLIMAARVIEAYDPDEQNGSAAATWTLEHIWDSTWGQALQIDLVNTLAAL